MHVKKVDGKPVFATHLIECIVTSELKKLPFQAENEGVVCYSKEESAQAIKKLKELNIDYKITSLQNATVNQIDESITYQSRTEIIEHLRDGKKPKHKRECDLEKRVETLELQVKVLMERLNVKN